MEVESRVASGRTSPTVAAVLDNPVQRDELEDSDLSRSKSSVDIYTGDERTTLKSTRRPRDTPFELADGTLIYEMSLRTEPMTEGTVAINFTNDMAAAAFATLRDHLLRDTLYIVLQTDSGAPVMRRTASQPSQPTSWRTIPCQ